MSQFMKSETRPAPDAVLLFRAQEYALRVTINFDPETIPNILCLRPLQLAQQSSRITL